MASAYNCRICGRFYFGCCSQCSAEYQKELWLSGADPEALDRYPDENEDASFDSYLYEEEPEEYKD